MLSDYAMEPALRGYRKVLPSRARTGIRNFYRNIAILWPRAISCKGEWPMPARRPNGSSSTPKAYFGDLPKNIT